MPGCLDVRGDALGGPRRRPGEVRIRFALVQPVMAIDPVIGPARDLAAAGAGFAPALAQGGEMIEPTLPLRPEQPLEEMPDAPRQTGALPVGRDRDHEIAAPQG